MITYPFTKEELLQAGESGFIDRSPAWNRLIGYLLDNFEMSRKEAERLAAQAMVEIKSDEKIGTVIQNLSSVLKFPSFEMVQHFTGEVMNFYNNMRM